ncbi:MAG: hypothetical protein QXN57_03250 [Desulfurococcaceae archaeon]
MLEQLDTYICFRFECDVVERVLGNLPDQKALVKYLVEKDAETNQDELEEDIAAGNGEGIMIFPKDERGIYIRERQIKGWFKETLERLSKRWKLRGFKQIIAHDCKIIPQKIYFTRNGEIIQQPDGILTIPIRVLTPKGARSAVKRMEYISAPASFSFDMYIDPVSFYELFSVERWTARWQTFITRLGDIGILGDRGLGEGRLNLRVYPKRDPK